MAAFNFLKLLTEVDSDHSFREATKYRRRSHSVRPYKTYFTSNALPKVSRNGKIGASNKRPSEEVIAECQKIFET